MRLALDLNVPIIIESDCAAVTTALESISRDRSKASFALDEAIQMKRFT
jgi:hypothetical protein